jgi:hypothetical protein
LKFLPAYITSQMTSISKHKQKDIKSELYLTMDTYTEQREKAKYSVPQSESQIQTLFYFRKNMALIFRQEAGKAPELT